MIFNKILEKEIQIFEQTYNLLTDIYRFNKIKEKSGRTTLKKEKVYTNIKCAISRDSKSLNNQTTAENKIDYTEILFISSNVKILQGDEIVVTFPNGDTIKYFAGNPEWYDSHQEIILTREDRA